MVLLALLGAACEAPPRVTPAASRLPNPVAHKVQLSAGSLLNLRPATIGPGQESLTKVYLDALWRVAVMQSPHFDGADGADAGDSPLKIELHYQPANRRLTTTLARPSQPPIPLAAVRVEEIGRAIDVLAWQTRAALGERVRAAPIAPLPCTAAYSADPDCVRLTESGLEHLTQGHHPTAIRKFREARRHDPACPITLLHLAASLANRPDPKSREEAQRTAREALGFDSRLTLNTQHRLARVLLLTTNADARLMELGQQFRRDRPHDPHGRFTVAQARCRLGHYPKALELLKALRTRWPRNAVVRYQLAFAMLATGAAKDALPVLEEASRGLPRATLARPLAMALYHTDHHKELRRFLSDLRREPGIRGSAAEREVMRMQASHALLTSQPKEAARYIAESFAWLRNSGPKLSRYALDVVEDGDVLARLGQHRVLADSIDGFLQLGQLPPAFANAITYLGGMLAVLREQPTARALATLEKSHDTVLHGQLQAAIFRHSGQLQAETAALKRVLSSTESSLAYASYARALQNAGEREKSTQTIDFLRRRLLSFNQRTPHDHPLMTPGRAMAYLATRR